MDYFRILNLNKEPFSNSPDPAFFFQSGQHQACLQKLELSLRMRRGLNVVIGEVGTGKTTLCRQLIRKFARDGDIETHLILDPDFGGPTEFLGAVVGMLEGSPPPDGQGDWQLKERIKKIIFRRGIDEKKNMVLIIDEGQKIPAFCLEILREFLNYETNEYKLLQIVIFAQKEFDELLKTHANFADRVNLYHLLGPLNFRDTRKMIRYRVRRSSEDGDMPVLFSLLALWAVYRATGGYPRKIMNLCHQTVLAMIIKNRSRADGFLVRSCVRRALAKPPSSGRWRTAAGVVVGVLAVVAAGSAYLRIDPLPVITRLENTLKTGTGGIPQVHRISDVDTAAGAGKPLPGNAEIAVPAGNAEIAAPAGNAEIAAPAGDAEIAAPGTGDAEIAAPPGDVILTVGPAVEAANPPAATAAKVAAVRAEALPEKTVEPKTFGGDRPPEILGRVALRRHDTLSWMCVKVYGYYSRQIMEKLVAANPKMGNPNYLGVGQYVVFPAVPVETALPGISVWWVKLGETATLQEAFGWVRNKTMRKTPIRIIPYWNARNGMRFAVVLWRHFFDEVSARNQLKRLAAAGVAQGTVIAEWEKQTVFFADPFPDKRW